MAEICVTYYGWADCEACCSSCDSCTDPVAISTTPPHDEDNCKSRAAAVCDPPSHVGGIGGEMNTWATHEPIDNKAIDRVFKKRMQELANIKKK